MIGVVCPESQRDFVIEFFEFFKTPWEFYRGERSYDVLLATEDPPRGVEAKLLVTYGLAGHVKRITSNSDQSREAYLEYDNTIFPVYGRIALIDSQGPVLLRLRGSGGTVAVDETSHRMRVIRVGFDLFEEVRFLLTSGQPERNSTGGNTANTIGTPVHCLSNPRCRLHSLPRSQIRPYYVGLFTPRIPGFAVESSAGPDVPQKMFYKS